MVGDCDVHDPSVLVRDDHQDEQQSARGRRHDEEVGGRDLVHVIRRERAPGLGRRFGGSAMYFATVA